MTDPGDKLKLLNEKLEWPVRILFTVAVLFSLIVEKACEEHYYPLNVFIIFIIALWAYFFKQNWIAILLLSLQILIAYFHANMV
jgi:hypothetical protein